MNAKETSTRRAIEGPVTFSEISRDDPRLKTWTAGESEYGKVVTQMVRQLHKDPANHTIIGMEVGADVAGIFAWRCHPMWPIGEPDEELYIHVYGLAEDYQKCDFEGERLGLHLVGESLKRVRAQKGGPVPVWWALVGANPPSHKTLAHFGFESMPPPTGEGDVVRYRPAGLPL